MKIAVINGPNLNMLGIREPDIYGKADYNSLVGMIKSHAEAKNADVVFFQSNHEGAIVDFIQQCYFDGVDAIIINPAAYTHTSVAICDALKAVSIPYAEVHISAVEEREAFRQVSFIRDNAVVTITGRGFAGYLDAMDALTDGVGK